jgi:hypothetical protein
METAMRWLLTAVVALCLPFADASAQKPEKKKKASAAEALGAKAAQALPSVKVPVEDGEIDMDQIRDELGVNQFTAPSIENILAELMDLRPIPIEKLWKDMKADTPQDRALMALASGRAIADGLLAVIAEKPSRVEPCARALLRYAKGLGVSDHVSKHSRSILEKAAKENWLDVRKELVKAQADVEAGMMALKDEEIAHLVSLGGWIRGMDIVSALVSDEYTPEKAARLVQPEALDYFIDRIGTLSPRLKKSEVFTMIETNLKAIQEIAGKEDQMPPSQDEVKKIRQLASQVVDQI